MKDDKENIDNVEEKESKKPPKQTVIIQVEQYQSLRSILEKNDLFYRALLLILCVFLMLAFTLSYIFISVKKHYPYNDIVTNTHGAITMEDENNEITYWLYNPAVLWANSGIEVKQGDVITIRTSGASNTAIHHLVNSARENKRLQDRWVESKGYVNHDTNERDRLRCQYRILPNMTQDALLMQVVPKKMCKEFDEFLVQSHNPKQGYSAIQDSIMYKLLNPKFEDGSTDKVFLIGEEYVNLLIPVDGFLYFAVNDIVLSPRVINAMICEQADSIFNQMKCKKHDSNIIGHLMKAFDTITNKNQYDSSWLDKSIRDTFDSMYRNQAFAFGDHPYKRSATEMEFYKENNYYDAWFEDNVGSYLIVVERKKN